VKTSKKLYLIFLFYSVTFLTQYFFITVASQQSKMVYLVCSVHSVYSVRRKILFRHCKERNDEAIPGTNCEIATPSARNDNMG
jgi:hypothetical protein